MCREEAAAPIRNAEPESFTTDYDATRGVTGSLARLSLLLSYSLFFIAGVRGSNSGQLKLKRLMFIYECAPFTTGNIYLFNV